jgi:hypothetical protein
VQDHGEDKGRPEDPDEPAGREDRIEDPTVFGGSLQPMGVVIEGLGTEEHLQIAVHVHEEEGDHDQAGHCHDDLLDDRASQRPLMNGECCCHALTLANSTDIRAVG